MAESKKKIRRHVARGIVFVKASFNNTSITVTDVAGNVIAWSSAGCVGFKGSRKSTPFAAQSTAEDAVKKAMEHGLRNAIVYVRGPGSGRESAIRACASAGLNVTAVRDVTPVPHNGCRPRKSRRV